MVGDPDHVPFQARGKDPDHDNGEGQREGLFEPDRHAGHAGDRLIEHDHGDAGDEDERSIRQKHELLDLENEPERSDHLTRRAAVLLHDLEDADPYPGQQIHDGADDVREEHDLKHVSPCTVRLAIATSPDDKVRLFLNLLISPT